MNSPISQLGFLCIFHLIGGAAVGYALRGVLRGKISCNSFFFFLWGALFGGIPLLFGIQESQKGAPYFFLVQSVVFATAILVVAFIPDEFLEILSSPNITSLAVGGLFLMIGIAMLVTDIFELKSLQEKLLGGGIFVLVGGAVLLRGLWLLLKS
jgi:hypothetical protein